MDFVRAYDLVYCATQTIPEFPDLHTLFLIQGADKGGIKSLETINGTVLGFRKRYAQVGGFAISFGATWFVLEWGIPTAVWLPWPD